MLWRVNHSLILGSRSEEAFETSQCAESMDVGQIGRCFRTSTIYRTPQASGVITARDFLKESLKVCFEQLRSEEDRYAEIG